MVRMTNLRLESLKGKYFHFGYEGKSGKVTSVTLSASDKADLPGTKVELALPWLAEKAKDWEYFEPFNLIFDENGLVSQEKTKVLKKNVRKKGG